MTNADRLAGRVVEGAMAAHHRRRLGNLGHAESYAPPDDGRLWAAGDPSPRKGNAVDILIDGAQALPEIVGAIRGARRHVHIAGWAITPHFALTRDEPPVVLRELLAEAAERVDVRVLLWAGAPRGFRRAAGQVFPTGRRRPAGGERGIAHAAAG